MTCTPHEIVLHNYYLTDHLYIIWYLELCKLSNSNLRYMETCCSTFSFISDIDECLRNTDGCLQDCVNTVGSFSCECAAGFTGNGITCTGECYNRYLSLKTD